MFCPKCGNQLPDGSAFCGKCGAKLAPAGAAAPAPTGGVPSRAAASGLSGFQIAALVLAVAAVVFALMPWLLPSDELLAVGGAASAATSFLSLGTYSTGAFQESYGVLSFMDFADAAEYLISSMQPIMIPVMAAWVVGLVLLVIGAVLLALGRSRAVFIAGSAVLLLAAAVWSFFLYPLLVDGDWAKFCINPIACALCCLAALVMAIVGGSPKRQGR